MMKLFRWWFNGKTVERVSPFREPEISVGSLWVLHATDDPFPPRAHIGPVAITGVRDGWVRYSMGKTFPDERMKIDSFLYCYKPKEEL
jgi:hypothetical protein